MTARWRLGVLAALAGIIVPAVVTSPAPAGDRFPPRFRPAATWTGESLFLFGGGKWVRSDNRDGGREELLDDAAEYDLEEQEFRRVPKAPLPRLYRPGAVTVGRDVILVGTACDGYVDRDPEVGVPECPGGRFVAARFDRRERRWREVRLPEALRAEFSSTAPYLGLFPIGAVGRTAVFGRITESGPRAEQEFWTYAPRSGRWLRMDAPPAGATAACVTPARLVALTTVEGVDGPVQTVAHREPTATSSWVLAPPGPQPEATGFRELACADDAALIRVGNLQAPFSVVGLDTGVWTPIGWPANTVYWPAVGTGDGFAFAGSGFRSADFVDAGQALDLATGTWTPIPGFADGDLRGLLWTGTDVVAYDWQSGEVVSARVP